MNEKIADFLACHPYALETKRTYQTILTRLASETDPATLTAADLLTFIEKPEWSNPRRCVALAACQKYLAWLYGRQHPALSAKLKRSKGKPQRTLTETTVTALLASFDRYTPKGARDLALCALALDTGLRCSELCRLTLPYVDLEHRTLQVIVKGGQWAHAIFGAQTAAHLAHWLTYRPTVSGPGYLFTSTRDGRGLKPNILNTIVRNWGKRIQIQLSPHDLRRTFATLSTLNGAPERVLMEGGRWSHSEMIHRYTRALKLEAMRPYLPIDRLDGKIKA